MLDALGVSSQAEAREKGEKLDGSSTEEGRATEGYVGLENGRHELSEFNIDEQFYIWSGKTCRPGSYRS